MSKTRLIEVTINGSKLHVPEGTTILDASSMLEIRIPTLCHHEELSSFGGCRLCIVEISRPDRDQAGSWIDSSCVCPVSEGMNIETDSDRVVRGRKLMLELLLSRAPEAPKIRELAAEYGIEKPKFSAADGGESNCILCGMCIRVCNELIGANAIGTAGRGLRKEVMSPFNIAGDLCIGCTACAAVCPTDTIKFEMEHAKLRKNDWGVALDMIFCPDCGQPIGTNIHMEMLKESINIKDDLLSYCPACRRKKIIRSGMFYQDTGGRVLCRK